MTGTRIRRGGSGMLANKSPAKAARKGGSRAGGKGSRLDRWLARVPVSRAAAHRMLTGGIVLAAAVASYAAASFFGLPTAARMELAEAAARAGYEVQRVEVHGTRRMEELAVYSIALGQVDRSMLNVDLSNLRDEIMKLSWVSDARVSRRLPDTLVVDIVEREPAAVWQNRGRFALIDARGVVLEPIDPQAMPDLPLVVGADANVQASRFARLMEAAPALKPVVAGATWVGNRRWDLRFESGETLSLPEGDAEAASALVNFARLDGINRLLGRGIRRFDMRDPDKFVMRMPQKPEEGDAAPSSPPVGVVRAGPVPADEEELEQGAQDRLAAKEQG